MYYIKLFTTSQAPQTFGPYRWYWYAALLAGVMEMFGECPCSTSIQRGP